MAREVGLRQEQHRTRRKRDVGGELTTFESKAAERGVDEIALTGAREKFAARLHEDIEFWYERAKSLAMGELGRDGAAAQKMVQTIIDRFMPTRTAREDLGLAGLMGRGGKVSVHLHGIKRGALGKDDAVDVTPRG